MASLGVDKFVYGVQELGTFAGAVGTWTNTIASNLMSFNHSAAAESAVSVHFIPKRIFTAAAPSGAHALAKISVLYTIGTAALSSAPTAVLDQITSNATTAAVTRAGATQTLAFRGTDTVGLTSPGVYAADISITTPILLPQTDSYVLEMTWPCATTSVLKIFGFELYFQG